jgi:hypothetical protein
VIIVELVAPKTPITKATMVDNRINRMVTMGENTKAL